MPCWLKIGRLDDALSCTSVTHSVQVCAVQTEKQVQILLNRLIYMLLVLLLAIVLCIRAPRILDGVCNLSWQRLPFGASLTTRSNLAKNPHLP